jgi:hypothetical protein
VLVQARKEIRIPINLLTISFFVSEVEDNKTISGSAEQDREGIYRPVKQYTSPRTHIQYDAVGNKRAQPIRIPNGMKGSRPNAQPHSRVSVL